MPITRNNYAAGQWHAVTPGAVKTQFTHNGPSKGKVVYTESDSLPADFSGLTPVVGDTQIGDNAYFPTSELAGSSIYFWPISEDAEMTIVTV